MSKIGKHIRDLIRCQVVKNGKVDGYSLLELIIVIMLGTIAMPALTTMFTQVFANSHRSEIMTMANLLAIEQMEIIIADKAGTGAGYGYATITDSRYDNVHPTGIYSGYARRVDIVTRLAGTANEHLRVFVYVNHYFITTKVSAFMMLFDHSGLP